MPNAPPPEPIISFEEAENALFLGEAHPPCREADAPASIRCLIRARYAADEEAMKLALALYDEAGSVAGLEREQDMDGGFRGRIHLVPELPAGKYRKHLMWITEASRDITQVLSKLAAQGSSPIRYRHKAIVYRFLRSVGRTTPSAYAGGWQIGYNVSGSLHRSGDAVRETLFHEVFHLNDAARGDWSKKVLGPISDDIVRRCGTKAACLAPYAPGDTMVRGGTYYAFQPDNGDSVHEYGAELALRYYRESRAAQRGEKLAQKPFKCGPSENQRAWDAIVAELFGGVDITPRCP